MYFYPHHIGDFIRDTSRLTDSQCMAYLRLIWAYYDTEEPLPANPAKLAFQIGASVPDVSQILEHYFRLDGDFYRHERCDKVIAEYHEKGEKAKIGANARWKNAKAMRTDSERNANASELHANHKPITDNLNTPPTVVKRASRKCPPDFSITESMYEWANEKAPGVALTSTTDKFKDHTFRTAMTDWEGAWRNWIRKDFDDLVKKGSLPTWREDQRKQTQKAVPGIALGMDVNPVDFFTNLGNANVTTPRLG